MKLKPFLAALSLVFLTLSSCKKEPEELLLSSSWKLSRCIYTDEYATTADSLYAYPGLELQFQDGGELFVQTVNYDAKGQWASNTEDSLTISWQEPNGRKVSFPHCSYSVSKSSLRIDVHGSPYPEQASLAFHLLKK